MRRGENLNPHTIEEPWSVRRHIGGLVSPVIEVVVAEETDVRHKNPGVDVDSVKCIDVVSTVCLGDVPVRLVQVPLPAARAGIIAFNPWRIHAELRYLNGAHGVGMEVAALPFFTQYDYY